jgi:Zn-dependent M16 (insulinase) family peptidase
MSNLHGFELLKVQEIPELNTDGKLYRHIKTGAEVLSLTNDDENKVFGINFRTTPQDSTGVAHILEHVVLAGSEKYPVKEPFIELVKGSLQTFLNAFTYPDKTCYPCASQNLKDFYNLIDVYVDAVFHPLILRHTFEQEGWHYELDEVDAPLVYKGVVFNEMKGAYSDPNDLLGEVINHALYPDNTYQYDSGGHPRHIPELTYEQFTNFHATYYHPSNAKIFWYGDDDPEERLRRTAEFLEGFEHLEVDSAIPLQAAFSQPVKITRPYAVSDEDQPKYYTTTNWVLGAHTDPETSLGLGILNHILVGTQASPLRKALIDSRLGDDVIGGGLSSVLKQISFSTGLKGVAKADLDKVETLIDETLTELSADGIDPNMIAASMNTVEFALRENNTGSFPRGLGLMLGALTTWLHDMDPFKSIAYEAPLQSLKRKLEHGERYFENLIQNLFLENSHRAVVVLEPDPDLNQREAEAEKTRLQVAKQAMSTEELEAIVKNTAELKRFQEAPNSPEALATLPALTLDDLEKENKHIPLEVLDQSGVELLYHDLFTNGIVYLDLVFDLRAVPQDLLPYLQLFVGGLVKMGTTEEDFVVLSQRIGRETGGISPSLMIQDKFNSNDGAFKLIVRAKSTMEKVSPMLDILHDILLTTNYDNQERFRQIITERKARMESSLVPSGHSVTNRRLKAAHSLAGWFSEEVHGIENLFFTRDLLDRVDKDWDAIAAKFAEIKEVVVDRSRMMINLTLDSDNFKHIRPQISTFIERIPVKNHPKQNWQPSWLSVGEGLVVPAQVNYVGKGANLKELGYEHNSSIAVILKYLRTTYLWDKIRVMGGAYGAFTAYDRFSGSFNYISYRDPNLLESLENYDGTPCFLREFELSPEELAKTIIGTIGDIDQYQLPDAKGYSSMTRYLIGYSDEARQIAREQVLATTEQDFRDFAAVLDQVASKGRVVVVGSADAIEQANQQVDGLLEVKQVL